MHEGAKNVIHVDKRTSAILTLNFTINLQFNASLHLEQDVHYSKLSSIVASVSLLILSILVFFRGLIKNVKRSQSAKTAQISVTKTFRLTTFSNFMLQLNTFFLITLSAWGRRRLIKTWLPADLGERWLYHLL